jgi:hypothetical protein
MFKTFFKKHVFFRMYMYVSFTCPKKICEGKTYVVALAQTQKLSCEKSFCGTENFIFCTCRKNSHFSMNIRDLFQNKLASWIGKKHKNCLIKSHFVVPEISFLYMSQKLTFFHEDLRFVSEQISILKYIFLQWKLRILRAKLNFRWTRNNQCHLCGHKYRLNISCSHVIWAELVWQMVLCAFGLSRPPHSATDLKDTRGMT